jgi:hypothetical protein
MRFGQINCGILTASTAGTWLNWKFSKEFKNEDYTEKSNARNTAPGE